MLIKIIKLVSAHIHSADHYSWNRNKWNLEIWKITQKNKHL
jgi:hypothetical protein